MSGQNNEDSSQPSSIQLERSLKANPNHIIIDTNTHKTEFCTDAHHHQPSEAPYYLNCSKYHNWQDHRRKPEDSQGKKYMYSNIYLGEGFEDKNYCLNWVEYLYHPLNYKTKCCLPPFWTPAQKIPTQEIQYVCHQIFCPKIHYVENYNKQLNKKSSQLKQFTKAEKYSQIQPWNVQQKSIIKNLQELKEIRKYFLNGLGKEQIYSKYGHQLEEVRSRVAEIGKKILTAQQRQRKQSQDLKNHIQGLASGQKINQNNNIEPKEYKISNNKKQQTLNIEPFPKGEGIAEQMRDSGSPRSNTQQKNQLYNFQRVSLPYENHFTEFRKGQQLSIIEDRHNEFKMFVNKDPRKICSLLLEYISAFINSEGGNIYLGIDDRSIVQGLDVPQKWIDQLLLSLDIEGKAQLHPPLTPQKYRIKVIPVRNNQRLWLNVIEVTVYPSFDAKRGQLTLFNRECYLRMNASNHRLCAADIIEYMRVASNNSSLVPNPTSSQPASFIPQVNNRSSTNIMSASNINIENLSSQQLKNLNDRINKAQQKIQMKI